MDNKFEIINEKNEKETYEILKTFNIELLDHIIVTEASYISMNKTKKLDKEFKNEDINLLEKALLVEENTKLKNEIKELNYKLENKEIVEEDDMEF